MTEFQTEWAYYLDAFRLHQGLTKASNLETRQLLRRSMDVSRRNARYIPRSYGLLSFTILNAWLSNWVTSADAMELVSGALTDVERAGDAVKSAPTISSNLNSLRNGDQPLDAVVRAVVLSYARVAFDLDGSDFENHWSLATAELYNRNFAEAVVRYDDAQKFAHAADWPPIGRSSLEVDIADTRFFMGSRSLEDSREAYAKSISEGIAMTEKAISDHPTDSKRHRWYWTLGWAYYELGGYAETDQDQHYAKSLDVLRSIRTPHDLIRKNLIATYAALKDFDSAASVAKDFMAGNDGYTVDVEDRWPYRSKDQLERWKGHLRSGGLPSGR